MSKYKLPYRISIGLLFASVVLFGLNLFFHILSDNSIRILGGCMVVLIVLTTYYGVKSNSNDNNKE